MSWSDQSVVPENNKTLFASAVINTFATDQTDIKSNMGASTNPRPTSPGELAKRKWNDNINLVVGAHGVKRCAASSLH